RLLTQVKRGEGDFEVIHLKNANATEAARVLDEAFNGRRQQQQQGGGRGFNPFFAQFAAQGARAPTDPQQEPITLVADTGTNSLLVQATPLDMLTIRRLLEKAIDSGDTDALIKTWYLPKLKYADASEVAMVLRDVYREQMNENPQQTSVGGFGGFS